MTTKTDAGSAYLKWGMLQQISDDLRSDSTVDLDAMLATNLARRLERDGVELLEPYEPTVEWIDLEAPENHLMRAMQTWTDEETGATYEPARWLIRTTALVTQRGE